MRFYVIAIFCLYYCLLSECANLPSSWGRCRRSDKEFSECLRKNVENAINLLNKPTPELGLTSFDPLDIPELYIGEGKGPVNVAQHFVNVTLHGLTNVRLDSSRLENNHLISESLNPELRLEGDYDMKGQILLLPVYGNGKFNVTLINMRIKHDLHWEPFEKKGKMFLKAVDFKVTMHPEKVIYKFDNLFGGQRELGDNINKVLNDNWSEVFNDVRDGYERSFAYIFKDLSNRVLSKVPEANIFLE